MENQHPIRETENRISFKEFFNFLERNMQFLGKKIFFLGKKSTNPWKETALPFNQRLYRPNLTTPIYEWKIYAQLTRHGAVDMGKFPLNSSTTLPAGNTSQKNRHDACSLLLSSRLTPAHDCDSAFGPQLGPVSGAQWQAGTQIQYNYILRSINNESPLSSYSTKPHFLYRFTAWLSFDTIRLTS